MESTEVIDEPLTEFLEKSDQPNVIDELPEDSKYDLTFAIDNYQRYFKYETHGTGKEKKQTGICQKCGSSIGRSNGSTNGMKAHLKSCDPDAYEKVNKRKSSSAPSTPTRNKTPNQLITDIFQVSKKWSKDNTNSKQLDKDLLKFICINRLPLNFVEWKGLENILPQQYELKGRKFMTSLLEKEYKLELNKLIEKLGELDSFALTADGWSSKNNSKSFMGLTVHYIDKSFHRNFEVAACLPTSGAKTAEAIAKDINDALKKVQLPTDKCFLLIRDAAPNMIKGASLAKLKSIDCFVHKLQLAVKDALKDYKLTIKEAKRVPALYNQSTKFREDFEKTANALGVKVKALIQNVPTRWNSVFLMLERLLEFRTVLNALSSNFYDVRDELGNKQREKIEKLNFDRIEALVTALKPIAELTDQLSLRDASIADILPIFQMFKKLWPTNELVEEEASQIRQKITAGLEKRMEQMKSDKNLTIATMLDPRYKDVIFSPESRPTAFNMIIKEMAILQGSDAASNNNSPPAKRIKPTGVANVMEDMINDLDEHRKTIEEPGLKQAENELNLYIKEQRVPYTSGPTAVLDYWRVTNFSLLKKLAQRFLAAPPSSTESERLFSQLKMIYTDKRGCLHGDHAEQQLFLRYAWSK